MGGSREVTDNCGPGDERAALWALCRLLWKISPRDRKAHKRLGFCRHHGRGEAVELKRRTDAHGHRAHYGKLIVCGKPVCPLCGPKIAAERAADIAAALTAHHANGGRVAMVTLTLPHTAAQRLTDLLDGLSSAWAAIRQNKTPRRLLKAHTSGWIKRLEVTVGANGWHPHLHLLIFLAPGTTDELVDELAAAIYTAWSGRLIRRGLGQPSPEHGVVVKILNLAAAHERVAEYAAKAAALELASAGTKRGRRASSRTPLQVLYDLSRDGLADDRAKWFEYVEAMHGRHHIEWSQGLRAQLLAELPELSDEDAAASDDSLGRLLGLLNRDTWKRIREWEHGPATVLGWAEIYDDYDQAAELVDRKLRQHGLGRLIEPDLDPQEACPCPEAAGRAQGSAAG